MKPGEFVKEKRNATKLTQPELAEKAGVGLRFVRDLEQGKETVRLDKVNQVLKLFGYEVGPVEMTREYLLKADPGEFQLKGNGIKMTQLKNKQ